MQATTSTSPAGIGEAPASPALNVVIVYEDAVSGRQARRLYESLVRQLGEEFQFRSQAWKFSVLGNDRMRSLAAQDTAAADIVIIALSGETDLPPEVKSWIDLWVGQQAHPTALAALFQPPHDPLRTRERALLRSYLEAVARRGGMDFFTQEMPAEPSTLAPLPVRPAWPQPERSQPPALN